MATTTIDFKQFTTTIEGYMIKMFMYDAVEEVKKKFKKANKKLAQDIAEDIISRYDIVLTHTVKTTGNGADLRIDYIPKLLKNQSK